MFYPISVFKQPVEVFTFLV